MNFLNKCSFAFALAILIVMTPNISYAQSDQDATSGEEFVQTIIEFGVSANFDETTSDVFGSDPQKLKAVLEAIETRKIEATITSEGIIELKNVFQNYSNTKQLSPEMFTIGFTLNSIQVFGDLAPISPEIATLLIESGYSRSLLAELENPEIIEYQNEDPYAYSNENSNSTFSGKQIRNWIIIFIVISGIIVAVTYSKKKKRS